jgi:formate dehydrogenase major subunit
VGTYPSLTHPANRGRICVRGWNIHEVASSPDRLKRPLLKKNGAFQEVSWDEALGFVIARLRQIRDTYGPDALAFLCSPRCSNEEAYLLQKFARTVIGTNNVDHGAGVYCNNSINALLEMIGVPATTNSIAELAHSDVIIVDGMDLARRMPTIAGAVIRAKLNGAKLVVLGGRRHRVAENADFFLQLLPGTEPLMYGAMAKVIVDRGLMNLPFIKARCRNYEAFLATVRDYDLLAAAEACGVAAELIETAALLYAQAKAAAVLYSTGVEARESETVEALCNLALLTGQIGKEGAGIFALAEHNNSQGVCDMGMLPDRLPGYGEVSNEAARRQVERVWQATIPATPGQPSSALLTSRAKGKMRAVWLCRYDPVSTASFGDTAESLQQCDLVVTQHLFLTETAKYAHVVLPTTAYGEEQVTFTSTERRIQLAQQVIEPAPGIEPAWKQLAEIARAMGAGWKYDSAAEVMAEIGSVVPFYSGASYNNLARDYGRQWPCTKDQPLGAPFLFSEPASAQFKFIPIRRHPQPVSPEADFPMVLIFRHSLYYWNQNVLIRHSETLKREYQTLLLDYPEGFVEIGTDDAKKLGIRDGQKVRLRAPHGSAVAAARISPEVRSGTVYMPYFVRQVQQQLRGSREHDFNLIAVRVEKETAA